MNRAVTLLLLTILAVSCGRDESVPLHGTITIDSRLYGAGPYYAIGFTFISAMRTPTNRTPMPDILVLAETNVTGDVTGVFLSTSAFLPSFQLHGEYPDAASATSAFSDLTEANPASNWIDLALPVEANEVWVFRTRDEQYAKIRIIEVKGELREGIPYAECTFEWTFQPDGSTLFPN
jgi:hypothetical protein